MPPVRVLLIGMMGAGKTTVGLSLARRTGWRYVDNDELLVLATGRTARELRATGGDASLRAGEAAVVEHALQLPAPVIVGIAAGVVLDPVARARLRAGGHVVWLRAGPATLVPRLGPGSHRPFMEGDVRGWVERTVVEREPLYREVAHSIVDVDDRSADQVAQDILAALQAGVTTVAVAGGADGPGPAGSAIAGAPD